jgi:hypothetical protein
MNPAFYIEHSPFTAPGRHANQLAGLPTSPGRAASVIQGLCIYDVVAADFYGHHVPEGRLDEIHLRGIESILDRMLALNPQIGRVRPFDQRLVSRCHHYALLLATTLRAHQVSARLRCGFGAYFNPGKFEDHWICEYWDGTARRWIGVDAQLDEVWKARLKVSFDPCDVPKSEFLVAAQAWRACRRGEADPANFGIEFAGLRGLWYIAGSLIRDLAALNKREMLPWDVWGAQPQPNANLDAAALAFFDRIAELTLEPDAAHAEMQSAYSTDIRTRVPPEVVNALRQKVEVVGELCGDAGGDA